MGKGESMQATINLWEPEGPHGASQDKRTLKPRESSYVPEVTQHSCNLAPGLPPSMCGLTVTRRVCPQGRASLAGGAEGYSMRYYSPRCQGHLGLSLRVPLQEPLQKNQGIHACWVYGHEPASPWMPQLSKLRTCPGRSQWQFRDVSVLQ